MRDHRCNVASCTESFRRFVALRQNQHIRRCKLMHSLPLSLFTSYMTGNNA